MNAISKVVTTCLVCATKYNLDFGSASDRSRLMSPYNRGEGAGEEYGDGAGGMPPKGIQSEHLTIRERLQESHQRAQEDHQGLFPYTARLKAKR
ncbi:hypothetical protein X975_13442, partial [Stegodyphus mimosarum]